MTAPTQPPATTPFDPRRRPASEIAHAVLYFWFDEASPSDWFRRSTVFDQLIWRRFGLVHVAASDSRWPSLEADPAGALALILVLDQFSRNLNRGSAAAFAQDAAARAAARRAIARRFDLVRSQRERAFFYIPFMHSEAPEDQALSIHFFRTRMNSSNHLRHAAEQAAIISRFGRFPHRNDALGRRSTPAERQFLRLGGFSG